MQLQQNINTQNFQGRIFINDKLSKKHKMMINQIRPHLNKAIEPKNYNMYIGSDFNTLEIGVSKKAKRYYSSYSYNEPSTSAVLYSADTDLLLNKAKSVLKIHDGKLKSNKSQTFGEKCKNFFNKLGENIYNFLTR